MNFDLLAVITGSKIPPVSFAKIASTFPDRPKTFFTGTVNCDANDASIKRELDTINTLCKTGKNAKKQTGEDTKEVTGKFAHWWHILLNHSTNHSPVKVIPDCNQEELQNAQEWAIENLRHKEQNAIIKDINNVTGSVGLVAGPPGTGKTLVGGHLGIIYCKVGGAVMFATPTQKSADTIAEYMVKIAPDIPIVRVYRQADENRELRKDPPSLKETVDIQLQAIEIAVILAARKEQHEKVFGKAQYSLARTMPDRALSGVDGQQMITYKPQNSTKFED